MKIYASNQVFKAAGKKVFGFKKRKKEEWIQGETWEKLETRRGVKQQISSTQSELEHEVKKNYQTRQGKISRETGGAGRRGCC